jgi:hypothetical protein
VLPDDREEVEELLESRDKQQEGTILYVKLYPIKMNLFIAH